MKKMTLKTLRNKLIKHLIQFEEYTISENRISIDIHIYDGGCQLDFQINKNDDFKTHIKDFSEDSDLNNTDMSIEEFFKFQCIKM